MNKAILMDVLGDLTDLDIEKITEILDEYEDRCNEN